MALTLPAGGAFADQLQCNSEVIAGRATRFLPAGSIVIDFCSLCETKAQLVRVERATVVKDCDYEVELSGPVLAATEAVFKDGFDAKLARWARRTGAFSTRVDLAYVYVEVERNDFRWLGAQLGLDAKVKTESIQLPTELYAALGPHPMPEIGLRQSAMPAPTAEMIRSVWHHHYAGKGKAPILVELVACLEIDNKKDSETRFDCTKLVEGPVDKNATVYAWSSWLVPKGDELKDVTVQYLLDGVVRTTKDMPLSGAAPRTRAFVGAKPGKAGRWTIQVVRGDAVLGKIELEAR